MIDEKGLRANVGMIVINDEKKVVWGRRSNVDQAWQFPQGGVQEGESVEEAMYRELHEELGLAPECVEILGVTNDWLVYYLPKRFRRYHELPMCIGQKQKWFLLKLIASDDSIALDVHDKAEFDGWEWVDYWYPIRHVINFKQDVYRKALRALCHDAGIDYR